MTFDLTAFFSQTLSAGLVTAAIAFPAKSLFKWWLDKSVETHKADLLRVTNTAVEEAKHELKLIELRQTKLIEKQALVIAGVYSRLETAHEALTVLAAPNLHGALGASEELNRSGKLYNDFAKYYGTRSIWLPAELSTTILKLSREMQRALTQFAANLDPQGDVRDRSTWSSSYTRLHTDFPMLRDKVETELRKLLGVIASA